MATQEPPSRSDTMSSTGSVDRPTIDDLRTMSYNRVNIPPDLKNTICSQIMDSTESLPLWQKNEYDDAYDNQDVDTAKGGNFETRRLAKGVPDSSDVATPKLEKSDPMDKLALDQQKTAQPDDDHDLDEVSKGDRPGTLRRLTTRIKKTMSSDHSKDSKAVAPNASK